MSRAVVLVVGVGVDDRRRRRASARRRGRPGSRRPGPCCWSGGRCGRRRCARATSIVRSVEPSSMISHSTTSKPGDLAREVGERCRERRLLVQAGDLDDELHARAGRGDGACREVDAVHSLAPSIPHGERDDHPAGPGPGPCGRPPQPALVVARAGARWRSRWARWSGSSSTRPIPTTTSYYSLLWGRELLHGVMPSFDGYRAPTEHPLASPSARCSRSLGDPADRVMVGATLASFVVLAAGALPARRARRSRRSSGWSPPRCCARASTSRSSRRAATSTSRTWRFVVWAAALEAERPRRGTPVFVLLACAGLLRPEAWLLSGLYWLWCIVPATWPQRVRTRCSTGVAAGRLDARSTGRRPATRCSR